MLNQQALLLSIRPHYAHSILTGTKLVELRRIRPKVSKGDLVVVYASGTTKGIVGAFEVEGVTEATPNAIWKSHNGCSGLSREAFDSYFDGASIGFAIQIGKTGEFQEVIPLETLRKRHPGFRPPQSYHYWDREELLFLAGKDFGKRRRLTGLKTPP